MEESTTDVSEGSSITSERRKRGRPRKKDKTENSVSDKNKIKELEDEIKKLKTRLSEEGIEEEHQPDYSLLPKKKNLPTIEQLRDEIRFEPHYAIEGLIIDCANKINNIATCSNSLRGGLVRELRICARKVQAVSIQLSSLIKEGVSNYNVNIPQEVHNRMKELENENAGLRECINEFKDQIQELRNLYSNDDMEDNKKIKKMEMEIKKLKEEKESMKKEIGKINVDKTSRGNTQIRKNNSEERKNKYRKQRENKKRTISATFTPSNIES